MDKVPAIAVAGPRRHVGPLLIVRYQLLSTTMCQEEDRSRRVSRASWEGIGRYREGWFATFPTKHG